MHAIRFLRPLPRPLFPMAMLAAFLTACGDAAPTAPAASSTKTTTTTAASADALSLTSGTWTISQFSQRTEDKASKLAGYVFTFTKTSDQSGTVKATRNGSTVTGSWSHRPAVTYYGATSTEAIVLNFGTATDFSRLSKTWNVGSTSTTKVSLDNPEILEDEHVVFSRQ